MSYLNKIKRIIIITIPIILISCTNQQHKKQNVESLEVNTQNNVNDSQLDTTPSVIENESRNTPVLKSDIKYEYNREDRRIFMDSIKTEVENAIVIKEATDNLSNNLVNGIPPDGTYIFDIAYAEWQGRSMSEKVLVVIKGKSITIISEGNPSMSAERGKILDKGTLLKHNVTGDWLISNDKSDADLEAYGDCVGGPMVIDFKNKKYWTC